MLTQNEIYEKLARKAALLMVLLSVPGLALSLYGALIHDAAFVPVMVQTLLVLFLVLAAIPAIPMGYKQRLLVTVVVLFILGAVATLRYANPTIGYTYTVIISLTVTLMLSRLGVYLALAAMNLLVGAVAVSLFDLTPVRVALQFITFTGFTAIGLEIIFTLIGFYKQQSERLDREKLRQRVVSEAANVAFIEFEYATGLLFNDSMNAARHGLKASDSPILLSDYAHQFPADSWYKVQSVISDFSQQPEGSAVNFVHSMITQPENQLCHYRVTGVNIKHDNQLRFIGISADVTDEIDGLTEASNLTDQINLVSNAGGVGLIEFFHETKTFKCNSEVSQRLGIEPSKEERPIDLFYAYQPQEIRQAFLKPRDELADSTTGKLQSFVHPFYLPSGELRHYRVTRVKRELNGRLSFLGLSLDITEEYASKAVAEESANNLLAEQERQKQMYAVIGHELRTPAASLQMMLDDLEEGEILDPHLVGSNIEHLLGVIDTLRAVAQPERMAQAEFKNVLIDELLSSMVSNLSGLAARSGVELTADLSNLTGESVHIQSSLVRQVVANLIKNAIIHSGGNKVQLSASGELKGDCTKALTIRISDNGRGIAETEVDKLFEAYQRGDTSADGTGLGLFVCKEIVTMMGGDLRYETSEQGGAEFVIELLVNLSSQNNETPVLIENPLEGMRVLMAEDNNVIQMLTAKMLKKQGATVVVNSDGQQALDAYAEGAFDLVMSDIFMPELDGYGLVKGLRERGYTGPIVGLTAATIGTETDLMLEAGADIVISKPIELRKLQAFLLEYDKQI